jgi:hypothetical protein
VVAAGAQEMFFLRILAKSKFKHDFSISEISGIFKKNTNFRIFKLLT